MLKVGDTDYPLCLLDTLAVSAMVKDENESNPVLRHFYEWAHSGSPAMLPCFTVYTLMELRRAPGVFRRFIDRFQILPCVMLKGYAHLLEEEVAHYPHPSSLDPCAIAFTPLGDEGNQLSNLPGLLDRFAAQEHMWNAAGPDIVDGMVSLVPNYPPDGRSFTDSEIRHFVWLASFQQLALHDESKSFVRQTVDSGQAVAVDAFPTLKAMSYTVFYKFYSNRDRRPDASDAFDVLISAALPYVEAVITENHQADALRKTKRRDAFLAQLDVFTLRDFRDCVPIRAQTARTTLQRLAPKGLMNGD